MPLPASTAVRVFLLLATMPEVRRLVKAAIAWWSGKKIAVIGPMAAGKDSFIARLQQREIPKHHTGSPLREKVKSFDVKLALTRTQTIDVTCKGVFNVGGEPEYRDSPHGWTSVCKGADVIFYVMTVEDLMKKRFLRKGRVRQDLDWLQTVLPQLDDDVLVHVLVNKVDLEIASHTHYGALAKELSADLRALDTTVRRVLHPYEDRYTGATLISMKNKSIFTIAMHRAFAAVYAAFHEQEPVAAPNLTPALGVT